MYTKKETRGGIRWDKQTKNYKRIPWPLGLRSIGSIIETLRRLFNSESYGPDGDIDDDENFYEDPD